MTDPTDTWTPAWVVAPGEVLAEALEERGMSQAELARRMARPLKTINEIISAKAAITPETALQLELTLGISASLWIGMEAQFREGLARIEARTTNAANVQWAARFPVKELMKWGEIPASRDPRDTYNNLLRYFGVASPDGWDRHWGDLSAAYRLAKGAELSKPAVASWIRWGERLAEQLDLPVADLGALPVAARAIRPLSRLRLFAEAVEGARAALAHVGVALIVLPSIPGVPASGATRWAADRPMILLTLRYLTDDQFWHSLFHEIGHLISLGRNRGVSEDLRALDTDTPEEHAANTFARRSLIDEDAYKAFVQAGAFARPSIRAFSRDQQVSPGIVVGRLQHDRHIDWRQMNDLKRQYKSFRPQTQPQT